MHIKSLLAGSALALGLAFSGQAQELLDGSHVEEIMNIARGYGSATLTTQDNGNPKITGRIEGIGYQVYFMNCENNANCEDINFYTGFLDNKQAMDAINAWNRDMRFGRAYLDSDLDAVIEYDVNLEYGVSRENLDAAFSVWSGILSRFAEYIGYK